MATRCKFRGRRGILCDVVKIDGSLARNIDFQVANFQVLRKTRRKTSILQLQSVKIAGSLARNARFGVPTCLVKIGGSFVRNAVFSRMRSKGSRFTLGVWGLRVCSLDVAFTVATVRNRPQPFATVRARTIWPCLWEVLQRWSFLEVSDVSLLRFAWQAWHFVTFRRVLERVESRFAWQAQYFCDVVRRCVAVFRGRRSTLDVSIVIFLGRRSTLDVSCCAFFVNRIGRAASSGDKARIPWQGWHFVRCGEN